jgi:hypothetical protein
VSWWIAAGKVRLWFTGSLAAEGGGDTGGDGIQGSKWSSNGNVAANSQTENSNKRKTKVK